MRKQQMVRALTDYSVKRPSRHLLAEIRQSLQRIQGYGSVEIIVQDHHVVQISERNIKKTFNNNSNPKGS